MLIHSFGVYRRDGEHTVLNTWFRKVVFKIFFRTSSPYNRPKW
jgi:hypothetical protein